MYSTDKWLDYNNWCEINSLIENIDQNDFAKILKETDKPIFRNIRESHIVLKITSKKVTPKLIEAVQLILNNESIEFYCYLEVDITYNPDYTVLPKCDSGLSFEQEPAETDRISSYSPTQELHDKYTPKSIETNSSSSIISPVYKSNQIQKSIEEYVPEGNNLNSIVYTPGKVSNKEHDGYDPVNSVSNGKENNNKAIVNIPAKAHVTKRRCQKTSPIATEKRSTRSSSHSPYKKNIFPTKSPTNEKPSTSKRSSTKDSDFIEPLEKKAKQKLNEKKTSSSKFDNLFGDGYDSSQESDSNVDLIVSKSNNFFDNEELLSQNSQTSSQISNKSPDLFNDSDIGPNSDLSQEKEDPIELKLKEMLKKYPELPKTLDLDCDQTPTSRLSRAKTKGKKSSKDNYASEKKGITSFLNKSIEDSKDPTQDKVLTGWLSTNLIVPEDSSKKEKEKEKESSNKESSKKVRSKGPTRAERNQQKKEHNKMLEKHSKDLEAIKELRNEFVSLNEKEENVELL